MASPIVLPLNAAATVAGVGAVAHGGYVWDKSIQNAQDTLQKIQSSDIAFNKAKDLAGVPMSQQPTRQWQVGDDIPKKGYESKNYEYSANHAQHGRYYEYDTPQGKRVIFEHINDGVLHTHAGIPKDGANPYTSDFKKERYSNIYGFNNDHHTYYNK
ncbi:sugar-binding protein [Bacillus pseudomycoides]|uniref:Sugar-binding protein n=2 Tax=Bacillaceae TaxID=186817 RepID=A0AAJ3V9V8_9BACI|nr:HNH/endonuclease VII fold putative polymorphic toxin [Bacillus pseudomycoides]EEM05458.1 YD repeat protein [Bacillus pseudomycoides]EEM11159.1 YD repeat protein [Bacillus pseudomycoides]KFN15219.1 HNH/Endo VII supernuclease toxins family protein [Bacillus pseudomycoides]MCR8861264.1 HNH/endonuclease VII fold putative polymorphic toxin [Bacillus pseudomycoides]MDR4188373.1 sugar-binding protein [Bacillus pseudomycoides]